jgi:hypothetical protein
VETLFLRLNVYQPPTKGQLPSLSFYQAFLAGARVGEQLEEFICHLHLLSIFFLALCAQDLDCSTVYTTGILVKFESGDYTNFFCHEHSRKEVSQTDRAGSDPVHDVMAIMSGSAQYHWLEK